MSPLLRGYDRVGKKIAMNSAGEVAFAIERANAGPGVAATSELSTLGPSGDSVDTEYVIQPSAGFPVDAGRCDNFRMRWILGVLGGILIALIVLLLVLASQVKPQADLALELFKAALTLIVAILITGILSFVLTQYSAAQARRDERARVLTGALQELKAGYERVQVARFFLSAHPTGKTFNEQIAGMSEARSRLHKVQRERFVISTQIESDIQEMLDYLTAITNEYKANYMKVLETSLLEEGQRKRLLDGSEDKLANIDSLSADQFPLLARLIDEGSWTVDDFQKYYGSAKQALHTLLNEASGHK